MLPSCTQRGTARQWISLGWCAALLLVTSACSIVVDPDRVQCSTDGDCRKKGPGFARTVCLEEVCKTDPKWGCIGSVTWATPPPTPSPARVTARLSLSNLLTKAVVAGVKARVCGKLDPTCASPIQSDILGDDDGVLTVELDKFFDGYLEIGHPNMVPTMYFFNPPVSENRVVPYIPLVPPEAITAFGDQLRMMPRLDRGTVIGLSYDCRNETAEGVELFSDMSDEFTAPFYMSAGFPSLEATKTDASGQAGIANVVEGPRQISGRLASTGEVFGTVTVQSRPIQITYTSMLPTPIAAPK